MSVPAAARSRRPLIVEPLHGWRTLRTRELWAYRDLFYLLIRRDVSVRYKQTLLGAAWAVLQPLLSMLVLSVVFGRLAGLSGEGAPYPLFAYVGLLPWTYFAFAVTQAANSVVSSSHLITKVYFPRALLPLSAVISGTLDLGLACIAAIPLFAFYGRWPSAAAIAVPLFAVLAAATALGLGLWLSALNVRYRDVRFVVPFFVQLGLFGTPVIYPVGKASHWLAAHGLAGWLVGLNPMAGAVAGFRWALLPDVGLDIAVVMASTAVAATLVLSGAVYFARVERAFADVI